MYIDICDEPTCKAWCAVVGVASRLGDRILRDRLSSRSLSRMGHILWRFANFIFTNLANIVRLASLFVIIVSQCLCY